AENASDTIATTTVDTVRITLGDENRPGVIDTITNERHAPTGVQAEENNNVPYPGVGFEAKGPVEDASGNVNTQNISPVAADSLPSIDPENSVYNIPPQSNGVPIDTNEHRQAPTPSSTLENSTDGNVGGLGDI